LNGVESIVAKTQGGADNLVVNDLSGTGVVNVVADLWAAGAADDAAADNVIVNGTSSDDIASMSGAGTSMQVSGSSALMAVSGGSASNDRLTVNALAGDDVLDAWGVAAGSMLLTLDGGDANDVFVGGAANDILLGGAGDDVLVGALGTTRSTVETTRSSTTPLPTP
jgi:Ca2+-binding RTX toxin-like protein